MGERLAFTFALTGRRRLFTDTQGVALGYELAALSGRSRRRFELIEFLQRGCGAAPQFDVGLRRRNNELNELTNCRAAWARGLPLKGALSPHCPQYVSGKFATCSWPSLCEQSELQCCAPVTRP